MWTSRRLFQSAPLLLPAMSFVAGIAVGSRCGGSASWGLSVAATLAVVLVVRRWGLWASAMLLLVMFALGGLRSSMVSQSHREVSWPDGYVSYEGVVVSEVSERPKSVGMDVVIAGSGRKVKCYMAKDAASRRLTVGDRLQLTSRIGRNRDWRQGTFDYRQYQEVHGFSGQTFVRSGNWQRLEPSWQDVPLSWRLRLHFLCYRHKLLERYRQMGANEDQYAVLAAMTLGDKSAMTSELRQVYAVSGASHVLALSGLHLGIIYMLLSLLVVNRRLRLLSQLVIVTAIWAFVLLVGMPASVVRAAVMVSVYALLSLAGRNRMSVNALALAALCILMVNPDSLYDVGFQLSFLAMLAILLLLPLADRLVPHHRLQDRPLLRWPWGLATVSVAAQVGAAPLVAYYFGRFPTWFLLTNFVVIPTTTLILCLALAALLLPAVGSALLCTVGALNAVLTFIAVSLPCASIDGLHPSVLQTAMAYVIIVSVYFILTRYDDHS